MKLFGFLCKFISRIRGVIFFESLRRYEECEELFNAIYGKEENNGEDKEQIDF